MRISLVLLSTALAAIQTGASKTPLRMEFQQGWSRVYETHIESEVTQTINEVEVGIRREIRLWVLSRIESISADGTAEVASKHLRIAIRQTGAGGNLDFDSLTATSLPQMPEDLMGYASLLGVTLTLHMRPDGQVVQLGGIEEWIDNILLMVNGSKDVGAENREALRRLFTTDGTLENITRGFTDFYPTDPVAVGESWSKIQNIRAILALEIASQWTLDRREPDQAVLSMKGEIRPAADASDDSDKPFSITMQGTQTGETVVDGRTGWLISTSISQRLSGTVHDHGGNQQWPMSVENETRIATFPADQVPALERDAAEALRILQAAIDEEAAKKAEKEAAEAAEAVDEPLSLDDPLGEAPQVTLVSTPAAPGSAQPSLSVSADGRLYFSWLEPSGDATALRFAVWQGEGWSDPKTVSQGSDWIANWADIPSVAAWDENRRAAHWLRRAGDDSHPHAGDIYLSFSDDDGLSWSAGRKMHDDETLAEHGFASLVPLPDGSLAAFWLDGRAMDGKAEGEGEMALRYGEFLPDGSVRNARLLDTRVCECCRTSAARTSDGTIVAYRDRSSEETRDIAVIRVNADGASEPALVFEDGWFIQGCPVNGPAIDARGDRVVVAWFTMADNRPMVLAAFSEDAGRTFNHPYRIDAALPLGRVDVALLQDGSALVSRLEIEGDRAAIRVGHIEEDGESVFDFKAVDSSPARASGFQHLAVVDGKTVLVWTELGEKTQVRSAWFPTPRGE